MKLAAKCGYFFFFLCIFKFNTRIDGHPTLPPRKPGSACKQRSDNHVVVSRGSRCEDRCQAPRSLTSVRHVRICGLKQNPNQTSQLVSSFRLSQQTLRHAHPWNRGNVWTIIRRRRRSVCEPEWMFLRDPMRKVQKVFLSCVFSSPLKPRQWKWRS